MKALSAASTVLAATTLIGLVSTTDSATGFNYGFGGGYPYELSVPARESGIISNYEYRTLGRDESRITGVRLVGYYQDFAYLPSGQYEARELGRAESRQRDVAYALGVVAENGTGGRAPMEVMSCDESYLDRAEGRAEARDTEIEEGIDITPAVQRIIWSC